MDRVTVPFAKEDYALDLNSTVAVRGVVRLEDEAVVIEWREATTSLHTLQEQAGDVRVTRIPLHEIDSVETTTGWFRGVKLQIRTRTLTAIQDVPGARGNELILPIRRRDRSAARELAVSTSLSLSSRELRRIEEGRD